MLALLWTPKNIWNHARNTDESCLYDTSLNAEKMSPVTVILG
jgi:hypothetical protein